MLFFSCHCRQRDEQDFLFNTFFVCAHTHARRTSSFCLTNRTNHMNRVNTRNQADLASFLAINHLLRIDMRQTQTHMHTIQYLY